MIRCVRALWSVVPTTHFFAAVVVALHLQGCFENCNQIAERATCERTGDCWWAASQVPSNNIVRSDPTCQQDYKAIIKDCFDAGCSSKTVQNQCFKATGSCSVQAMQCMLSGNPNCTVAQCSCCKWESSLTMVAGTPDPDVVSCMQGTRRRRTGYGGTNPFCKPPYCSS